MNTAQHNDIWLEQFRLVKYCREIEREVERRELPGCAHAAAGRDWDRAMVDWNIHYASQYFDGHGGAGSAQT